MTVAEARAAYVDLRRRATARHPDEAEYVRLLGEAWDRDLDRLDQQAEVRPHVAWLVRVIAEATDDTVLEWCDAFPEALAEVVPA